MTDEHDKHDDQLTFALHLAAKPHVHRMQAHIHDAAAAITRACSELAAARSQGGQLSYRQTVSDGLLLALAQIKAVHEQSEDMMDMFNDTERRLKDELGMETK